MLTEGHNPEGDLFQLPTISQTLGDSLGAAPVRVAVVPALHRSGQKLAGGDESLLSQQRRHESREGPSTLVKFDHRRSQGSPGTPGLATRQSKCGCHGLMVEVDAGGPQPQQHQTAR